MNLRLSERDVDTPSRIRTEVAMRRTRRADEACDDDAVLAADFDPRAIDEAGDEWMIEGVKEAMNEGVG